MEQVWVAEMWEAHGEGSHVQGIYDSREAAWDGLKGAVETLYVDDKGLLRGKPRDEERSGFVRGQWFRRVWAMAAPMPIQGRRQPRADASGGGADGNQAG